MLTKSLPEINEFFSVNSRLEHLQAPLCEATDAIVSCYRNGGKVLLCGNGGSAADCEHITGELMKCFKMKRPIGNKALAERLADRYGEKSAAMLKNLEGSLPAIPLVSHHSLITAFANDVDGSLVYAQQVLGYGKKGDILVGISTSGNAANVNAAMELAYGLEMVRIGLTGENGGRLNDTSDIILKAPEKETYRIQEIHLMLYHLICAAVEKEIFG